MKLSEVGTAIGLSVVRDTDFENLGFLFDTQPSKLVFAEHRRFVRDVVACAPAAVVTTPELAPSLGAVAGLAVSSEPKAAFFEIHNWLLARTDFYGRHELSEVHSRACVHSRAVISPRGVVIGEDCEIGANAVIEPGTTIGAGVRIHPGAIIGAEGFQAARSAGTLLQLRHGGGVTIEDGAEVFANAVVARAVFRQQTRIGRSSRLGNGCFVSHNVQLGQRCFVGHNAVVNGNVRIGDDCWIGPNATIANLLEIGAGVRVTMGAAVIHSLEPGAHVSGIAAGEHRRMLRHRASICR